MAVAVFSVISEPSVGASDAVALHKLFGESSLASNVWNVRQRAANLPDDKAYQYWSKWVLPGEARQTPRLTGAFTTTHPAPISTPADSNGGILVASAYDLVDSAVRIGRLDELQERVSAIQPSNDDQKRAKLALQFLVAAARRDRDAAKVACDELLTLSAQNSALRYDSTWPELLVATRGLQIPAMRGVVNELCTYLSGQVLSWRSSGMLAWDHQVAALHGYQRSLKMGPLPTDSDSHTNRLMWIPEVSTQPHLGARECRPVNGTGARLTSTSWCRTRWTFFITASR